MRPPATKFLVFNAAAALVGVGALIAAAHSMFVSPAAAPCSERYNSMTSFSFERGGAPLAPADLQASLGGRDVGVMDNVAIGPFKGAPAPLAMSVVLSRERAPFQAGADVKGGAAFPWEPHVLRGKSGACLSYHVFFPSDFDFQRGGVLPGLSGGASAGGDRFLVELAWRPKGIGGVTMRVTENGTTRSLPMEQASFELPRGRWLRLEQEVLLNAPKKSDGVLRVWVDGKLAVDRNDVAYRAKPDVSISGATVAAFYGSGVDDVQAAAKAAKVWMTPFQVRWQE